MYKSHVTVDGYIRQNRYNVVCTEESENHAQWWKNLGFGDRRTKKHGFSKGFEYRNNTNNRHSGAKKVKYLGSNTARIQ